MPLPVASALVAAMLVYAALGLLFAVAFAARGAARIDADAAHTSWAEIGTKRGQDCRGSSVTRGRRPVSSRRR